MKWELKQEPEMVPVDIDPTLYKAQLEELGKVLYKAFCQLDPSLKSYQFQTKPYSQNGNETKKRAI